MAENKKRKSTRAFNIEKHSARHFDLEKEETVVASASIAPSASSTVPDAHSVSDRKTQPCTGGNNNNESTNEAAESDNGGSKKILLIIVAVIIAVALAFFGYKSCGSGTPDSDGGVPTDTTSTPPTQVDSTSLQQKSQADSTAVQDNTTEVPSTTDVQKGNATNVNEAAMSSQREPVKSAPEETASSQSGDASVKEKAMQVWDGVYGNGSERRHKLGSDYKAVQRYVNKMYREGYRH